MKTHIKLLQSGLVISAILFSVLSCNKDNKNPVVTFQAALNGSSETPPNNSTSTGVATLTYDTVAKKFSVTVSYTGIAPTAGHIHKGAPGVPGGVVFGFTDVSKSPFTYSSPVLTDAQKNDLYTGNYYVNLHSAAYPEGEIRGQLVRQP